ncbi:MAG TPA: hypothetical protein VGO93_01680 [Candidatus Xenobia bacterium]|jgi:hypothetical protein
MKLLGWAALAVFSIHPPAFAQFRLPSLIGIWDPIVGSGAVYDVVTSDGTRSTMELDCTGHEPGGSWFELVTEENHQATVVKQLLGPGGVTRVILKRDDQPAVEVPPQAVVGGGMPLNVRQNGRLSAHDHLTLAGRSWATDHYLVTDASHTRWDVWTSPLVPPCDLVCLKSGRITIALARQLRHVKSAITGTPQPLDLP